MDDKQPTKWKTQKQTALGKHVTINPSRPKITEKEYPNQQIPQSKQRIPEEDDDNDFSKLLLLLSPHPYQSSQGRLKS